MGFVRCAGRHQRRFGWWESRIRNGVSIFFSKWGVEMSDHLTTQRSSRGVGVWTVEESEKQEAPRTAFFSSVFFLFFIMLVCFCAEGRDSPPPPTFLQGFQTPLHKAAINGHDLVVQELLGRGAGINAISHGGSTALHNAAKSSSSPLSDPLVRHFVCKRGNRRCFLSVHYPHRRPLAPCAVSKTISQR